MLGRGYQETLKHIANMPNIELVMKVRCSLTKCATDQGVQPKSCLDKIGAVILDFICEILEMSIEEGLVYREERRRAWESNRKSSKPALQSWIDVEAARRRIHAGHNLCL